MNKWIIGISGIIFSISVLYFIAVMFKDVEGIENILVLSAFILFVSPLLILVYKSTKK